MLIRHYRDTRLFLERAGPFLLEAEAQNAMLLSLGARMLDEQCYLVTVEDNDVVAACAIRTPPFGLVITRAPGAVIDGLIDDVSLAYETLPSVLAPEPTASAFARRWEQRKRTRTRTLMQTRLFEARTVQGPASPPSGVMRPAIESELSATTAWVVAFDEEAQTGNPRDAERTIRDDIVHGRLYVWDDGGAVSVARSAFRTDRSATIALVYTPPDRRGRGYASALVAAVTQHLLDDGLAFCCIAADISNRTTNKIYPALGYRPVCEMSNIDLNAG